MKKVAFIIKDHKTYIHAEEAWFKFHGKRESTVLFVVVPKNDPNNVVPTLEEIIDENLWEEVVWVETLSNYSPRSLKVKRKENWVLDLYIKYREYLYNALDVRKINKLASKYKNVEKIFSGHKNTQEHLAARLKPSNLYLMDSGNIKEKVSGTGFVDYTQHSRYSAYRINRVLFYLTGLELYDRKKTGLFTIYTENLDVKHKVVKNNQDYKKDQIQKKKHGNEIFFISSPLYTLSPTVKLEGYIGYLKAIFDQLDIVYSNVVYIPNPIREKKEDIDRIINELGCKKDDRTIPVEIKVSTSKILPKLCISPYSTALVNINEIAQGAISLCCAWHPEFKYFEHISKLRHSFFDIEGSSIHFMVVKNAPKFFEIKKGQYEGKPLYSNFTDWNRQFT